MHIQSIRKVLEVQIVLSADETEKLRVFLGGLTDGMIEAAIVGGDPDGSTRSLLSSLYTQLCNV